MEVEIVSSGGKKVNAHFEDFTVMTDQSKDYGGEGTAPEPFQLFLASIGTCVGINVVVFCQKRGIHTEDIKVFQQDFKNPETGIRDRITIKIQLPRDFPEKYKKAVIRAAETCAVKKHLSKSIQFETELLT